MTAAIPATKSAVLAWAEAHGVAISHERADVMSPCHHVHANIDAPRTVFRAHGLHNLGLWDGEAAPNWREVGRELIEADIGPCEDPACAYCADDEA